MQPVEVQRRRRRAHSTPMNAPAEKPAVIRRRKKRRRIGNALALGLLLGFVVVAIIIMPKEPIKHAYYSIGGSGIHGDENASYYSGLVISEVMASNQTAMPDEKGEFSDWVEIWNSSDHAIDLYNVGLSDDELSISFLFPRMTIQPDERIIVVCDKTNQAVSGKPLHAKFGLSSKGETIVLYDPNTRMIHSVKTPIMSADESYALQANGTWVQTPEYSPGYENTSAGHLAYRTDTMVTDGALIISEICPDPLSGYRDADGELCDWVELYNTTGSPVSLDNYALSDRENKPLKWRFPEGAMVAPYGYYIVYCSGKDVVSGPTDVPHANFSISAEHDTIVLADSRGRLVDRVTIDNIPEDASYARNADGSFSIHYRTTPQLPNTEDGANRMDVYLRALNESGVYITEVMASNDSTETASGAEFVDWIELYNSSGVTVDLSGYGLSDSVGRARKWQFAQGTTIAPGEYKIVWCDGEKEKDTAAEAHTSFKLLKGGSETLVLADPTGKILDKVVLPAVPTNVSYGRASGREGFFYYDVPSPGAQNGATGFLGYAEAPQLTVAQGKYLAGIAVGVTIPEDTTVYYSLDGSVPGPYNSASKPYNGETIEVNETTVLRARAFPVDPMYRESTVTTGTYLIDARHKVPVVSVVVDPYELWNEENGMLAAGPDMVKPGPGILPFKNTVYREFGKEPREGYMEYFDENGQLVLSQGVAIGLIGDYSLDLPQKSMKLRAKSLYGEKTFAAALFEDRPYTEYKSVVLRNCGNDGVWSRVRDGFQSRLLDTYNTQVIHQAWKPVAVYLNGEYWGHYNLRERVDRFFIAQHEGLMLDQADDMDILVGSGSVEYGSGAEYKAMIKKLKNSDPANNPEDRAYLDANIDIDNFLEYMALEMFAGNSDIGNTRYYRLHGIDPETGERYKWKWIWYDADYGFWQARFNSPYSYTKKTGMGQQNIDNTIFRTVLSVPEYRDLFLRKLGDIFQTFTTDHMLEVLEGCLKEIEPEMTWHFSTWAELHDPMVISEWPTTVDGAIRYWEKHVNNLRNTLKKRPYILWGQVREQFKLTNEEMEAYFGPRPEKRDDAVWDKADLEW